PRPPGSTLFPYTTLFRSRIANLDRGDAAAGRPLEIGLDREPGDLREAAGRVGELRKSVLDRGLERLPTDVERHHAIAERQLGEQDRKSTRLNSSHDQISY